MKLFLFSAGLFLFSSCCKTCEEGFSVESHAIFANVFKNGKLISHKYDSVYAISLNDTIFKYSKDPYSFRIIDSCFILPLNTQEDKTGFVFVDEKLNKDTVIVSYRRAIKLGSKVYQMEIQDLNISFLSSGLSSDSSALLLRGDYNNLYNLKVVKK